MALGRIQDVPPAMPAKLRKHTWAGLSFKQVAEPTDDHISDQDALIAVEHVPVAL